MTTSLLAVAALGCLVAALVWGRSARHRHKVWRRVAANGGDADATTIALGDYRKDLHTTVLYVLLAVGSPIAWLAWSGPVVMYVFLRWISGIPFTEAQALRTRGEDYARYQRSTPMLFPWFPKPEK